MRIILFLSLLIVSSSTWAGGTSVVTVGTSASCDYVSISQASVNEPASDLLEIRIPKNYNLTSTQYLSSRRTSLRGGYDTCTDTTPSGKTVLTGTGSDPIFISDAINSTTERTQLNMVDLEISGGNSTDNGGVWSIKGSWEVTLNGTILSANNSDQDGGAIFIEPSDTANALVPRVLISSNSILSNNTAVNGGAIACDGGGSVSVWDTQLSFNEAGINGGAVHMNNGCSFYLYGADLLQGILFNDAEFFGGGVYAAEDSLVFIDSNRFSKKVALISSNSARSGGGVTVADDSRLVVIDATIDNNTASISGGGIYSSFSDVDISRLKPGAQCKKEVRCSSVSNNSVTSTNPSNGGGGAIATFGGTLEVKGTYIENNSANFGSAIRARFMEVDAGLNIPMTLIGNVVAGNRNAPQVVYLDESSADIAFTTFVDNEDMDRVIEMSYPTTSADGNLVNVSGSIFVHPGGNIPSAELTTAGAFPAGDCNRNEPNSTGDLEGQPRSGFSVVAFEDRAGGDYRLQEGSIHLDYCSGSFLGIQSNVSANGFPKPVDDSSISNLHGTYDLGGLERYKLDLIFKDSF